MNALLLAFWIAVPAPAQQTRNAGPASVPLAPAGLGAAGLPATNSPAGLSLPGGPIWGAGKLMVARAPAQGTLASSVSRSEALARAGAAALMPGGSVLDHFISGRAGLGDVESAARGFRSRLDAAGGRGQEAQERASIRVGAPGAPSAEDVYVRARVVLDEMRGRTLEWGVAFILCGLITVLMGAMGVQLGLDGDQRRGSDDGGHAAHLGCSDVARDALERPRLSEAPRCHTLSAESRS
ncbi:MAG: hypothetical protein HY925_01670, partial [Elusimicrobia bacterium]|nr:hypothetical protein [Elusimicrobiota bacterium]